MIGTLIQVPVLIAVFNVLGESPLTIGAPFLWIDDLSLPDTIWQFDFHIPFFGNHLSVLPFAMTLVTIVAAILHKDPSAPEAYRQQQRRNLYLMAAGFFVLFYPFPASMVFYWTCTNVLQLIQQQIWAIRAE